MNNTRHEIAIEAKEKRARKPTRTGMDHANTKLNAEQIDWLKANFATTKTKILAKVLNVTERTIRNYARRNNLVKDETLVLQWRKEGLENTYVGESLERHRQTIRSVYAQERRRILYGLEQKTRYKLGCNPCRKSLKSDMKRKKGYVCGKGSDIIYYTDDTKRSEAMEKHAVALGFEIRKK